MFDEDGAEVLYKEEAGQRQLPRSEFKRLWARVLAEQPRNLPDRDALESMTCRTCDVCLEAWDASTFRCSTPAGGEVYTQWHRLFATGTLADGRYAAVEAHWKCEGLDNFAVTSAQAWIHFDPALLPETFSTKAVSRDYLLTNSDSHCILQ